jgi:NAD(P)-dependent dehydrogenase (short-subunit alcohol dehydrogenase family)
MGGGRARALLSCLVSVSLSPPPPLLLVVRESLAMATPSRRRRPRTFLVTGSTDGIGRHTSRRLASDGHALLVHGRRDPTDPVASSLVRDLEGLGASRVAYISADLGDLEQVRGLAEDAVATLRSWQGSPLEDDSAAAAGGAVGSSIPPLSPPPAAPALDCLINNAGVFDPEPRRSAQGYDATLAVNVLAPFVLTRALLPCLVRGEDARVITTSSVSQSRTLPDLDRLFARTNFGGGEGEDNNDGDQTNDHHYDFEPLPYSAHSSYSHSKLGDLLFTVQLARVLSSYRPPEENVVPRTTLDAIRRIQCLTMDPGTVNTKMLLAGWGPCGIPVRDADNTYKLATGDEYASGASGAKSGSYHFGWGTSDYAKDDRRLVDFWNKLSDCTGVSYGDLWRDCF